jgi:enoyl-CoA hydratase/carnithine racemase
MGASDASLPTIEQERLGSVLRLTMSNPGKKNAITKAMYLGLAEALEQAQADPEIRVVWVRGAGGDFSSGNVVEEFDATVRGDNPPVARFLKTLIHFPKPIVAEVEGVAIGVGVTMLMHCDLVFAAEGTRFRLSFVNLGLVPEAGASYILPRLMGPAKAAELLLLGGMFDAAEAKEVGLVSRVTDPETLSATAEAAVQQLCAQPPQALMKTKAMLRKPLVGSLWERAEEELRDFVQGLEQDEFREAFAAFTEKRKPVFK